MSAFAGSRAACECLEQSLSVLGESFKAQSEATDRLDHRATGLLAILRCVAALALTGLCALLFLLF